MLNEALWLMPLILLPGVALLIVSTSSRYYAVHDEIHRLMHETKRDTVEWMAHELDRARRFRNALVSLYTSVALFSLGSLLGGLTHQWPLISTANVAVLTVAGVACVVYASLELIRESRRSLYIIHTHYRQKETGLSGPADSGPAQEEEP